MEILDAVSEPHVEIKFQLPTTVTSQPQWTPLVQELVDPAEIIPHQNPTALVDYSGIPVEMRRHPQWVLFSGTSQTKPDGTSKMVKKPVFSRDRPVPKINDPGTWVSWPELVQQVDSMPSGSLANLIPTFAFSEKDHYVVLDFDKVYDPQTQQWVPGVLELVQYFGTYTEGSMSGTGLHVICRGSTELAGDRNLVWDGFNINVEIYGSKHFMSLTGKTLKDVSGKVMYGDIQDCQAQLDEIASCDGKAIVKELLNDVLSLPDGEEVISSSLSSANMLRKIEAALKHIPAENRDIWLRVGMALKAFGHEGDCEDTAWELFDAWSKTSTANNYDCREGNYKQWQSFQDDFGSDGVTLGTVFHYAREGGWDGNYDRAGDEGERSFFPADIAHEYHQTLRADDTGLATLVYSKQRWFRYIEARGWHLCSQEDVLGDVVAFMQRDEDLRPLTTKHFLGSVLMNLRSPVYCKAAEAMPCWLNDKGAGAQGWMSFTNGKVVNVVEFAKNTGLTPSEYAELGIVKRAGPHFFSKDYVDYDFDLERRECPEFNKFIQRVLPDAESREMAQELAGLAVAGLLDYEVFFVLVGDGGNGKSVLLDMLAMLVGKDNVSSVKLGMLAERFQAWPLVENKLNITDELPTDVGKASHVRVEDKLKSYVSAGEIEVEFKGKEKYLASCTTLFIMATNGLPTFRDRSNGMWRRIRVIEFPVAITDAEKVPKLAERVLAKELPGIWLWAVVGLRRVLEQNFVFEGARSKFLKDEHRGLCDPEKTFLTTCYEPCAENYFIPSQLIYDAYRFWCGNNGRKPVALPRLLGRVPALFPDAKTNRQETTFMGRKRGVLGIKESAALSEEIAPAIIIKGGVLGDKPQDKLTIFQPLAAVQQERATG